MNNVVFFSGDSKQYSVSSSCSNGLAGNFNDKTTSLKISSGCVRIYKEINCAGSSLTFTADSANIGTDMNDSASSFRAC
jgi:hypothetical protein